MCQQYIVYNRSAHFDRCTDQHHTLCNLSVHFDFGSIRLCKICTQFARFDSGNGQLSRLYTQFDYVGFDIDHLDRNCTYSTLGNSQEYNYN